MRIIVRVVRPVLVIVLLAAARSAAAASAGDAGASNPSSSGADHGHFFFYVAPLRAVASDGRLVPGVSPEGRRRLVHLGGGGEANLTGRLGVGTDFGGIPRATGSSTVTIISVNLYYHPLGRERTLDPYFTAGVSGLFYEPRRKTGGPNIGAGATVWSRGAFGATVEVRRTLRTPYREFRIGVSIRQ